MSSVQIKDKAENTAPAGNEWLFTQDPADPFTVKKMSTGTLRDYITTSFVKYTTTNYTILDDDEYDRIEVDTTTSAVTVTLPLMANNTGRRIEIALVRNDVSLDPVTIKPNATDANKLSNSGLASMTLLEPGQSVILQQSDNSDRWEVVSQGIATYGGSPIYACRAWVNFDGTGTVAIRASGNVSSITDNEVGTYTVNFTTPMPDNNYCTTTSAIVGMTKTLVLGEDGSNIIKNVSRIRMALFDVVDEARVDSYLLNVAIFR
jgi:hypothetical protein